VKPNLPICRAVRAVPLAAALLCSVAMQRPAIGQAAPLPTMRDLQGATRSLRDLAGPKGIVIFFWAGWSERSIEELKRLDGEQKTIRDHGVSIVAVNVEHQAAGEAELKPVKDRIAALGVTLPVIVDEGLNLFRAYGVVSVPSTALVNAKGELAAFFSGYSAGQREELFDAIDVLAGVAHEKSVIEVPKGSPAAVRRYEMGRSQLAAGRIAAARASFVAAAEADAAFPDPLVDLAALALDEGDPGTAGPLIEKALALDAKHRSGLAERARLLCANGKASEAHEALKALAVAAPTDNLVAGYLEIVGRAAAGTLALPQAIEEMTARRAKAVRR
jgi:peroxiredoxin